MGLICVPLPMVIISFSICTQPSTGSNMATKPDGLELRKSRNTRISTRLVTLEGKHGSRFREIPGRTYQ